MFNLKKDILFHFNWFLFWLFESSRRRCIDLHYRQFPKSNLYFITTLKHFNLSSWYSLTSPTYVTLIKLIDNRKVRTSKWFSLISTFSCHLCTSYFSKTSYKLATEWSYLQNILILIFLGRHFQIKFTLEPCLMQTTLILNRFNPTDETLSRNWSSNLADQHWYFKVQNTLLVETVLWFIFWRAVSEICY